MRRLALAATWLVAAAACTNERAESLRAEIEKAKKERVEAVVVERARHETADIEAALSAARTSLEQARDDSAKLESDRDQARSALAAGLARSQKLQDELAEVARRAQEGAAHGQELDAKIARVQARASWVRDQADVLAREIRPEDAAWATARRIDTLGEFVARVAAEYPDDPVLAELARGRIRAENKPTPDRARAAAEQAARLRDRFASVYELAPAAVAASAPAHEVKP